MIINSVKISNFKNFEDVEVKLGKMNVLVGANASGKTNFIEALKFLRNLKNYGLENAISLSGGADFFQNLNLKNENKVTRIEINFEPKDFYRNIFRNDIEAYELHYLEINYLIEIQQNDFEIVKEEITYKAGIKKYNIKKNKFALFENGSDIFEYGEFTELSENGKLSLYSSIKNDIILELESGASVTIPKSYFHHVRTNDPIIVSVGAKQTLSHLMKASFLNEESLKHNNTTLFENSLSSLNFFDFDNFPIYDFDLKKAKQSTPITSKVDLEENGENLSLVIKRILADKERARSFSNLVSDALPFIKTVEMNNFYRQSVAFNVQEQHSEARFPSALLSDGTIAVTAIIAALFFEKQPFMVFEEPEHGVHPALIAKLVQYFYDASEKKQIIITTHNPEIVKHIQKLEDLLLVSRDEKGFAQISRPIEQEMVKTFLKNELGIDELFTQNLLEL